VSGRLAGGVDLLVLNAGFTSFCGGADVRLARYKLNMDVSSDVPELLLHL